jgi:hypothetical protein
MMKRPEFVDIFEKRFPNLKVFRCVDYNDDYFIIEAVEDFNTINFGDPFYAINKKNGAIGSFTPAEDPDAYFEAVEKRTIYSAF